MNGVDETFLELTLDDFKDMIIKAIKTKSKKPMKGTMTINTLTRHISITIESFRR